MSEQRDLALLLKSRFPLVVIETHEEARAVALLERICNQEQWPLHTWSIADGLNQRLIKEIARDYHKVARTLVFVGPRIELPPDLQRLAARFELSLASVEAI